MIIAGIAIATLLWADLANRFVWFALIVTLAFGIVGFVDDYLKISKKNTRGLVARKKYFWLSLAGFGTAVAIYVTAKTPVETSLIVPFLKDVTIPLGLFFIPWTYLVIVGSSNAVNLTDGLDGLAIMPTVLVASALAVFAYATGNVKIAGEASAVLAQRLSLLFVPPMPVETLEKSIKTPFETVDSRLKALNGRVDNLLIFRRFGHPRILPAAPI